MFGQSKKTEQGLNKHRERDREADTNLNCQQLAQIFILLI